MTSSTSSPIAAFQLDDGDLALSNLWADSDAESNVLLSSMADLAEDMMAILEDDEALVEGPPAAAGRVDLSLSHVAETGMQEEKVERKPSPESGNETSKKLPAPVTPIGGGTKLKKAPSPHHPRVSRRKKKSKNMLPKRPLSAYGVFYQQEYRRALKQLLINELERKEHRKRGPDEGIAGMDDESLPEDQDDENDATAIPDPKQEEQLQKSIGRRWRTLPASQRAHYARLAQQGRLLYHRDMEAYHHQLGDAGSIGSTNIASSGVSCHAETSNLNTTVDDVDDSSKSRRVSIMDDDDSHNGNHSDAVGAHKPETPTGHHFVRRSFLSTPVSQIEENNEERNAKPFEEQRQGKRQTDNEGHEARTSPDRAYYMPSPTPPNFYPQNLACTLRDFMYPPTSVRVARGAPPPLLPSAAFRQRAITPIARYEQQNYFSPGAAVVPPSPGPSTDSSATATAAWGPTPPSPNPCASLSWRTPRPLPPIQRWCIPPGMELYLPASLDGQYYYHGHRRYKVRYECYRVPRDAVPQFMERLQRRALQQNAQYWHEG